VPREREECPLEWKMPQCGFHSSAFNFHPNSNRTVAIQVNDWLQPANRHRRASDRDFRDAAGAPGLTRRHFKKIEKILRQRTALQSATHRRRHMKKLTMCAAATAVCGAFFTVPAWAFNPQPDPPARFGMMGIVFEQTARVNVVAVRPVRSELSPGPCRVTIDFFDGEGKKLVKSANLILNPGKASQYDLIGPLRRGEPRAARTQFLPAVQVLPNRSGELRCLGVAASVEVFDASGRTSVLFHDPDLYVGE
jgi:hypothetical protein